jgi:hypothetical protein
MTLAAMAEKYPLTYFIGAKGVTCSPVALVYR